MTTPLIGGVGSLCHAASEIWRLTISGRNAGTLVM